MEQNNLVKMIGYKNLVDAVRYNISLIPTALGNDPFPIDHSFVDGLYIRKITIPKGNFVLGAGHYEPYFNFVESGDMSVLTAEGVKRIKGPCSMSSPAGIQRFGYAYEDTVWTTIHKNPDNEQDLEVLDKRLHDRSWNNPEMNKIELPETFNAKRFRHLTERIYLAEKTGFWSDWTEEQQKIYMSGDWEEFSNSRGYSEEEISELREWLEMKEEAESRGLRLLSLVSDLVYTAAIRSLMLDKNGEIELSSHAPALNKDPYINGGY